MFCSLFGFLRVDFVALFEPSLLIHCLDMMWVEVQTVCYDVVLELRDPTIGTNKSLYYPVFDNEHHFCFFKCL